MLEFDLTKQFGTRKNGFLLEIKAALPMGKMIGIFGSSGAGKSSLLRLLSGLERPDTGFIKVENEIWTDTSQRIFLKTQKRKVGYLFQHYSLFPNMTVAENLNFAAGKNPDVARLNELLAATQLMDKKDQYPTTLSGGEQQRAALARALVQQPALLLLDEPLAALDDSIRYTLQNYISALHAQFKPTTLLVSHDRQELARLCDLVIEIENGKVVQSGKPDLLFDDHQTVDLTANNFRVLTLTRSENTLTVELVVDKRKVKIALDHQRYPELKSGDTIALTHTGFKILSANLHL